MKYAPRKVYIKENGSYTELSYEEFCNRREKNGDYADKLFIPVIPQKTINDRKWRILDKLKKILEK